ncbi:hypothetical protein CEP53_015022 [Fusarium sp. AF-6]|nr:hypothetical protein CEP53_015022 [Fusarium sp. AF-6]
MEVSRIHSSFPFLFYRNIIETNYLYDTETITHNHERLGTNLLSSFKSFDLETTWLVKLAKSPAAAPQQSLLA